MRHAAGREGGRALASSFHAFALAALALCAATLLVACGDTPAGSPGCRGGCPDGTMCDRGTCVPTPCAPGTADCNEDPSDGCEVTLATDGLHCGACGERCEPVQATGACVDSHCTVGACNEGFGDCDLSVDNGCEQDLSTDPTHCGACDGACPGAPHATATCAGGHCGLDCAEGFDDCDGDPTNGCESELATDLAHCGSCTETCALSESCETGACAPPTCTAPAADCNQLASDGCETDTASDELNCGMCGQPCGDGATCVNGACTYACRDAMPDPITGQRCPIATPCTAYAQCGTQLGAPTFQYWYCSPTLHTCQYLPQTGGFVTAPGTCAAQLVVRQLSNAPWDKRIVPPDGVDFRAGTTVALEVTNTTTTDLYLDQLPLTLELAGTNPSRFDVSTIHLYQVGNISDYGDGNNATQFVCSSPMTPFGASTSFTLGTGATGGCGGSFFSRVRASSSQRFILNLAFASTQTFLDGRQYRLRLGAPLVGVRARTSTTGTSAPYTACTLPATGILGAYLIFREP